jgi:hypothetical protein
LQVASCTPHEHRAAHRPRRTGLATPDASDSCVCAHHRPRSRAPAHAEQTQASRAAPLALVHSRLCTREAPQPSGPHPELSGADSQCPSSSFALTTFFTTWLRGQRVRKARGTSWTRRSGMRAGAASAATSRRIADDAALRGALAVRSPKSVRWPRVRRRRPPCAQVDVVEQCDVNVVCLQGKFATSAHRVHNAPRCTIDPGPPLGPYAGVQRPWRVEYPNLHLTRAYSPVRCQDGALFGFTPRRPSPTRAIAAAPTPPPWRRALWRACPPS